MVQGGGMKHKIQPCPANFPIFLNTEQLPFEH